MTVLLVMYLVKVNPVDNRVLVSEL